MVVAEEHFFAGGGGMKVRDFPAFFLEVLDLGWKVPNKKVEVFLRAEKCREVEIPNRENVLAKWKKMSVQLFNHSLKCKDVTIYSVEYAAYTCAYSKNSRDFAFSKQLEWSNS